MTDHDEKLWNGIVSANPAMLDPSFDDNCKRWDSFDALGVKLQLEGIARAKFVAYCMTNGEQGCLPDNLVMLILKHGITEAELLLIP